MRVGYETNKYGMTIDAGDVWGEGADIAKFPKVLKNKKLAPLKYHKKLVP